MELRHGSWFDPLKDVEGKLAGFVSNPPYIPSDNISGLQAEVGRHEPRVALDGGVNGMDDLLHLCKGAAFMLKPGGFFAFEVSVLHFLKVKSYQSIISQSQVLEWKSAEVAIPIFG